MNFKISQDESLAFINAIKTCDDKTITKLHDNNPGILTENCIKDQDQFLNYEEYVNSYESENKITLLSIKDRILISKLIEEISSETPLESETIRNLSYFKDLTSFTYNPIVKTALIQKLDENGQNVNYYLQVLPQEQILQALISSTIAAYINPHNTKFKIVSNEANTQSYLFYKEDKSNGGDINTNSDSAAWVTKMLYFIKKLENSDSYELSNFDFPLLKMNLELDPQLLEYFLKEFTSSDRLHLTISNNELKIISLDLKENCKLFYENTDQFKQSINKKLAKIAKYFSDEEILDVTNKFYNSECKDLSNLEEKFLKIVETGIKITEQFFIQLEIQEALCNREFNKLQEIFEAHPEFKSKKLVWSEELFEIPHDQDSAILFFSNSFQNDMVKPLTCLDYSKTHFNHDSDTLLEISKLVGEIDIIV